MNAEHKGITLTAKACSWIAQHEKEIRFSETVLHLYRSTRRHTAEVIILSSLVVILYFLITDSINGAYFQRPVTQKLSKPCTEL